MPTKASQDPMRTHTQPEPMAPKAAEMTDPTMHLLSMMWILLAAPALLAVLAALTVVTYMDRLAHARVQHAMFPGAYGPPRASRWVQVYWGARSYARHMPGMGTMLLLVNHFGYIQAARLLPVFVQAWLLSQVAQMLHRSAQALSRADMVLAPHRCQAVVRRMQTEHRMEMAAPSH